MLQYHQVQLKTLREERGWSQEELARRSGVSRVTLSRIENDPGYSPRTSTFEKLAAAFDIPYDQFMAEMRPESGLDRLVHDVRQAEKSIVEAGMKAQHEEIDRLLRETDNPILRDILPNLRQGISEDGYVSPLVRATATPLKRVDSEEENEVPTPAKAQGTPKTTNPQPESQGFADATLPQ